MPLDPQAKVMLEALSAGPEIDLDGDINEFREQFGEMGVPSDPVEVAKTEDRSIADYDIQKESVIHSDGCLLGGMWQHMKDLQRAVARMQLAVRY